MKGNERATFCVQGLLQEVRRDKSHRHPKASAYPDSQAQPRIVFQLAEPPALPASSEESYTSHERKNLVSNTLLGAAPQARRTGSRMCAGWVLDTTPGVIVCSSLSAPPFFSPHLVDPLHGTSNCLKIRRL
jgi:hypothetical protein